MPGDFQNRMSAHFREKRDVRLRSAMERARGQKSGPFKIIDLGGRVAYWERVGVDFLRGLDAQITIQNLGEDRAEQMKGESHGFISFETGDARDTVHADNSFDFCHSNSVIEHVGLWQDMVKFANETRRLAPSYYVQTPNYWFPVDPHTWKIPLNHWLPRPMRASLMKNFPIAHVGRAKDVGTAYKFVDDTVLLTKGQMRHLFPDADLSMERLALLGKSIIAIRIGDRS